MVKLRKDDVLVPKDTPEGPAVARIAWARALSQGRRVVATVETRGGQDAATVRLVGDDDGGVTRSAEEWLADFDVADDSIVPELEDPEARQLGPFACESETSRKAALAAYPRQGTQRWQLIELLHEYDRRTPPGGVRGLTRDEMARVTGLSPNTIRPRVRELIDGGWVEEAEHFTRKSDAGHDAALVMLTTKAQQELARRAREASPAEPR